MAKSPLSRTFDIVSSDTGETIAIKIQEPELRSENLTLTTWGSSYVLANQLHKIHVNETTANPEDIKVLEIGAGTGVVGLSAATLWHTEVILTDLGPIIPGLATNISLNEHLLHQYSGKAFCGTLDWNSPTKLLFESPHVSGQPKDLTSKDNKALVIIAADTVYWDEHPGMICRTVLAWLKHGQDSRFIIAYPLRVAYLDAIRELWTLLEKGGLEALDEGREETHDGWDDEILHEWSVWRWRHPEW